MRIYAKPGPMTTKCYRFYTPYGYLLKEVYSLADAEHVAMRTNCPWRVEAFEKPGESLLEKPPAMADHHIMKTGNHYGQSSTQYTRP